jgi:hypothetical protein
MCSMVAQVARCAHTVPQRRDVAGAGRGGGADDNGDDSSDWEEVSEEGSDAEALSVQGLPLGRDLLDVATAAAAADDDGGGNPAKVRHSGSKLVLS